MTVTAPTLWDTPAQVEAVIDAALEAVEANADLAWRTAALEAVRWCAYYLPDFTADEVWTRLADVSTAWTHQPSALGPIFRAAAADGVIVKTGQLRRSTSSRRHRDLTVWGAA